MTKIKTIYSIEHVRLCAWLNAKRDECDVSVRQLARRLGWASSIVGKIFSGDRRLDVIEYVQLCQALEIDAYEGLDLVTPSGDKKRKKKPHKKSSV